MQRIVTHRSAHVAAQAAMAGAGWAVAYTLVNLLNCLVPINPRPRNDPGTSGSFAGSGPTLTDDETSPRVTLSGLGVRGWRTIVVRIYREIRQDRILAVAGGVTFYSLLAVFPAIASLVSFYGLFADSMTIGEHLGALTGLLPAGALELVIDQVKHVVSQKESELGFKAVLGILISIWSANAGMKAMFDALNVAYEEEETRSFFILNVQTLACTLLGIFTMLLAVAIVVVTPIVMEFIGLTAMVETLVAILRWPLIVMIVLLSLAVLYRYGPSRHVPRWRWVTWGSAFATLAWLGMSLLFSWYVSNFASYNKTYGSLGAAVGFMMWIWLSAVVVLIGGELNAEIEDRIAGNVAS